MKKGEIRKRRRTDCVAGALNDVSYKNDKHIPGISIQYFPKDVALWPKWTRFDRRHGGDFILQSRRPLLHLVFEDGCYKHAPLVKFGELRLPMNSAKKNAD